jgi:FixJ family two-component response regulator
MAPLQRIVYVVDDDLAIGHSLERLLNAAGFRVDSYLAPKTFLEVADDLSAGCVLLDLVLPDMNGLDVRSASKEKARPASNCSDGLRRCWQRSPRDEGGSRGLHRKALRR